MAGTAVTEPRRLRSARRSAVRPWTVAIAAFLLAVVAFYFWTAATSTPVPSPFGGPGVNYYGLMADALRHGHLALRMEAPQALLDLPNPYDPATNRDFRAAGLHDLSLRDGHLYAYWGPTAAIVLFAPLQVVGVEVSQSFAVALFASLGFLFSALTLRFLVQRFLPGTPRWAMAAACVFLALGNGVPFILRRPAVYEVALTCGMCFAMLGIWLLVTGWHGPSRRRLVGASLAFGLAMASRPTLGALGLVPLLLVVMAWRRGTWPAGVGRRRTLVALIAPFAICGLVLGAYNVARFGSPLEFGQKYQLANVDPVDLKTFDPAFIPSGLFFYLVAPPRPLALFPFLQLSSPPRLPWATPDGYNYTEAVGGALVLAPVLLWLLLLPVLGRRMVPDLRRIVLALTLAGGVVVLAMSFILAGATQRYAVDFMALLSLPALLLWLAMLARAERGSWRRRLAAGSGLLVLLWGSAAGLALGFSGYSDLFEGTHPKLAHRLQDVFAPVSSLATRVAGRPVLATVSSPYNASPGNTTWGSLGQGEGAAFYVAPAPAVGIVTVVAPRAGTYHLRGAVEAGPGAVADAAPVAVVAHAGEPARKMQVAGPSVFDVPLKLKAGVSRIRWTASAVRSSGPLLLLVQGVSIIGPDR
jgi:hypothetical protein